MKIYTPVKDFNGMRNNVRFINGVGETNDLTVAEWFRSNGYKVALENTDRADQIADNGKIGDESEFVDINKIADEEPVEMMGYAERQPDFDAMNPNELRDWMKANGLGHKIKNTRNKEKLLEIIRG